MGKNKEKDTTIWKPKGNQKITRPSGVRPRSRKVVTKQEHRAPQASRSQGYDAPSTAWGKLGLLLGAGAVLAYLTSGVKNSEYFKDQDENEDK